MSLNEGDIKIRNADIDTKCSDCDAPMSLVNLTFDWLRKEWADEVDFVVCMFDMPVRCDL